MVARPRVWRTGGCSRASPSSRVVRGQLTRDVKAVILQSCEFFKKFSKKMGGSGFQWEREAHFMKLLGPWVYKYSA